MRQPERSFGGLPAALCYQLQRGTNENDSHLTRQDNATIETKGFRARCCRSPPITIMYHSGPSTVVVVCDWHNRNTQSIVAKLQALYRVELRVRTLCRAPAAPRSTVVYLFPDCGRRAYILHGRQRRRVHERPRPKGGRASSCLPPGCFTSSSTVVDSGSNKIISAFKFYGQKYHIQYLHCST